MKGTVIALEALSIFTSLLVLYGSVNTDELVHAARSSSARFPEFWALFGRLVVTYQTTLAIS